MKPMLLREEPIERVGRYIDDNSWWLEQKLDGRRLIVVTDQEAGSVRCFGRDGQESDPPFDIDALLEFACYGDFALDGELMPSGQFWVFDLVSSSSQGKVLTSPSDPAWHRRAALELLMERAASILPDYVKLVPRFTTAVEKHDRMEAVRSLGGEGVVFRRTTGTYLSGKKSHDVVKVKFTVTIDVFVSDAGIEGKENIVLSVFNDDGNEVVIGKCSTHGKKMPPEIGDVVEVRYLYAANQKHPRLVQPRLLRVRDDKPPEACTIDQLHFTTKTVIPN